MCFTTVRTLSDSFRAERSPITLVIFDLDDTLYDEGDFVRGGFRAVGLELERRGVGPHAEVAALLEQFHFAESRAGVFQKLAARRAFPEEWIPDLVDCYRSHAPSIQLAADAREVLPTLVSRYRIGCVTDGWAAVQRRKIAALGVESYLHALSLTDELGVEYWKPHARAFDEVREKLAADRAATVVVGDNPERDMAGARNAGLRSIRLRRPGGYFSSREYTQPEMRSDFEISDLRSLPDILHQLSAPVAGRLDV